MTGGRRVARGFALAVSIVAALTIAAEARADVRVMLLPLMGIEATPADGWLALAARVENDTTDAVRGTLEVSGDDSPRGTTTTADVAVAPGATATIRLPARGTATWRTRLVLRDASGKVLASDEAHPSLRYGPLLVELRTPARLVPALRNAEVRVGYDIDASRTSAPLPLAVAGTIFDKTTGDPVLPEQPAAYGAATVVVVPSDLLSRLVGAELDALAGYVLSGGTLAVIVARPEDLRSSTLEALAGGALAEAGVAKHLGRLRSPRTTKNANPGPSYVPPLDPDDDPIPVPPPPPSKPAKPAELLSLAAELRDKLTTYAGANLQLTDFGASAPYGLGEIHLLPFDPDKAPFAEDPWVESRMVELVRHAWDRRAMLVFPEGAATSTDRAAPPEIVKQLDPNESSRWAILIAAALLLAYSVIAGPVSFRLATRAGNPLRALRNVVIFAAVTFCLVVVLGLFSKGIGGEARRLSMIETSGGMTRASVRRYRALFTPNARTLSVPASDASSALDVSSDAGARPRLVVERGGLHLEGVATRPWETVVVREESLVTLGGGVSLTREATDVRITNRLGRNLRGVLAYVPDRGYFHVRDLRDGASILVAASATLVTTTPPSGLNPAGPTMHVRPLGAGRFESYLESDAAGLTQVWEAISQATSARHVDWWPADVPVMMAQIDGGEGITSDAGLRVGSDRTLIRVVGFGGSP